MVIFWYPFCRQQQTGPGPNFEPWGQKNMDQIDQMAQRMEWMQNSKIKISREWISPGLWIWQPKKTGDLLGTMTWSLIRLGHERNSGADLPAFARVAFDSHSAETWTMSGWDDDDDDDT